MASLRGILAGLGIGMPQTHPEREPSTDAWIIDQPFAPQLGQSYELAFGELLMTGENRPVLKKVRIDGTHPSEWFDLEEQRMLDPQLQAFPVKGFRPFNP